MKATPIDGEHLLRWMVESETERGEEYLVDLSWGDGRGRCTCRDWEFRVWPRIGAPDAPLLTRGTTCKHVRLALFEFTRRLLPTWIGLHRQGGDER